MREKSKASSKLQGVRYEGMPPLAIEGQVRDRRSQFAAMSRSAPAKRGSASAFLASKLAILRARPDTSEQRCADDEEMLARKLGPKARAALDKQEPDGGVGYGMFYKDDFRAAFARGTSLYYEIVCPNSPGGNVDTWLYLTATNRAQRGVEALVGYEAQNDTRFSVFDWARPAQWKLDPRWRVDVKLNKLRAYLRRRIAHGFSVQALFVQNSTVEIGTDKWRNEVLLHNRAANLWDLVYRFDYVSTTDEQQSCFVGSWGPIVETRQEHYSDTARLGFLNTMLIARDVAGQWGKWRTLAENESEILNDDQGFSPLFVDPNYAFIVES
jgi:hypothetical protein